MRVIVLLLASILFMGMTAGIAGQGASGSPDVVTAVAVAVDDAPDVDTPVVVEPATVPTPERPSPVRSDASAASTRGRMVAVLVFRPPRRVASR